MMLRSLFWSLLPRFLKWVGKESENLFRRADDIVGMGFAKFRHGSETPGHSYGLDTGTSRRLHIDTGITYV